MKLDRRMVLMSTTRAKLENHRAKIHFCVHMRKNVPGALNIFNISYMTLGPEACNGSLPNIEHLLTM